VLDTPYLWHPIFVHFSIALLSVATGFYVLSAILPRAAARQTWITIAEWNLWVGLGLSVATLAAGWLAFNTVSHDDASHPIMENHALLAFISVGLFTLLALWSWWQRKTTRYPSVWLAGLAIIGFGFLAATGWRGGELVYGHGLAVNLPPAAVNNSVPAVPPPDNDHDHAKHQHVHTHAH
jgi:uncharacterized membrane protein